MEILVGQLKIRRDEERVDLVGRTEANDRAIDSRVAERPRDGDRSRNGVVAVGDRAQALDQVQVPGELRLGEALIMFAPIVFMATVPSRSW